MLAPPSQSKNAQTSALRRAESDGDRGVFFIHCCSNQVLRHTNSVRTSQFKSGKQSVPYLVLHAITTAFRANLTARIRDIAVC